MQRTWKTNKMAKITRKVYVTDGSYFRFMLYVPSVNISRYFGEYGEDPLKRSGTL